MTIYWNVLELHNVLCKSLCSNIIVIISFSDARPCFLMKQTAKEFWERHQNATVILQLIMMHSMFCHALLCYGRSYAISETRWPLDDWTLINLQFIALKNKYICRRCYVIICIIFRHFYDVFNRIVHYVFWFFICF